MRKSNQTKKTGSRYNGVEREGGCAVQAWLRDIQTVVDEIDRHIESRDDEGLTLTALAKRLGYSPFHTTRKFR